MLLSNKLFEIISFSNIKVWLQLFIITLIEFWKYQTNVINEQNILSLETRINLHRRIPKVLTDNILTSSFDCYIFPFFSGGQCRAVQIAGCFRSKRKIAVQLEMVGRTTRRLRYVSKELHPMRQNQSACALCGLRFLLECLPFRLLRSAPLRNSQRKDQVPK